MQIIYGKHRGTFRVALTTDQIGQVTYMQNISKEKYPGQSKIRYLPTIDLNPTKDLFNSFIYSRTSKNIKYCYLVLNI